MAWPSHSGFLSPTRRWAEEKMHVNKKRARYWYRFTTSSKVANMAHGKITIFDRKYIFNYRVFPLSWFVFLGCKLSLAAASKDCQLHPLQRDQVTWWCLRCTARWKKTKWAVKNAGAPGCLGDLLGMTFPTQLYEDYNKLLWGFFTK